jgi:GGDEF domain-containing protein
MESPPTRRRLPRPVADAPVDELLARVDQLAKGWLLALVEDTPMPEVAAVVAGATSADAPRLCDAIVRALADDESLRRLAPGGMLERQAAGAGLGAAAAGPARLPQRLRSVAALHAVIWAAIVDESRGADAELIAALADRLALVMEHVREAALRSGAPPPAYEAPEPPPFTPPPVQPPPPEPPPEPPQGRLPRVRPGRHRREQMAPPPPPPPPPPADPPLAANLRAVEPSAALREPGEHLWREALEREISHAKWANTPLTLVLAVLDDAERVPAVESRDGAGAIFTRYGDAVRSVLRRGDLLAREDDARAWVIARETGRPGGHALAERLASAVGDTVAWRGVPLTVSVGIAVLGEDGADSEALIEIAERGAFLAAATGISVSRAAPEEPGGSERGA